MGREKQEYGEMNFTETNARVYSNVYHYTVFIFQWIYSFFVKNIETEKKTENKFFKRK